jgi:6,7-dimethyl-8-ribityllumazine synthase
LIVLIVKWKNSLRLVIDGFISEGRKESAYSLRGLELMARLGFVVSEFNRDITYQMELLGREHARFLGAEVVTVFYVPGVYDMPIATKKLLRREDIDAVVTIGCVIQGETAHDEIVVSQAARKLMDLSLEFDKPVTLGITGPKMSRPDAHKRVDYAKRAVEAAVKLLQRLDGV